MSEEKTQRSVNLDSNWWWVCIGNVEREIETRSKNSSNFNGENNINAAAYEHTEGLLDNSDISVEKEWTACHWIWRFIEKTNADFNHY